MIDQPLIVLAGGFGTRLRSVVQNLPKPLVPVGGKPFLHHLLAHWVAQGERDFIFSTHHRAELILDFVEAESGDGGVLAGCRTRLVKENAPLGTGGAVAHVINSLDLRGSVLVANADTWLETGLAELAAAEAPSLAVVEVPNTERFGTVNLDGNRITDFLEKTEAGGAGWINGGLYNLDTTLFGATLGQPFSLERELFPNLARIGALRAVPLRGGFIDIGVPDEYRLFCRWVETGKIGKPL